jgi:hypothetical protein
VRHRTLLVGKEDVCMCERESAVEREERSVEEEFKTLSRYYISDHHIRCNEIQAYF